MRRRNSDERLRDLDRKWRTTGSDIDRLAYLRELERAGLATPTDRRLVEVIERRARLVDAAKTRADRQVKITDLGEGWVGPDAAEARHADGRPLTHPTAQARLDYQLGELSRLRRRVWIVVGDRVDRFDGNLRHRVAGTPWEREAGYIGKSTGPQKIWLLASNARSIGGSGLLMDSILEVTDTKTGETYWRHPSYDPTLWVWEKASRHKLEPWSEHAVERMVYLAQELGVLAGDLALETNLGVPSGRYDTRRGRPVPPALRSIIVNAINVHGEEWTRDAIEATARKRLGNPPRTLTLIVSPDPSLPAYTSFFWEDFVNEPWQLFGEGSGGTPLGPMTPESIQRKTERMVRAAEKNGYDVFVKKLV